MKRRISPFLLPLLVASLLVSLVTSVAGLHLSPVYAALRSSLNAPPLADPTVHQSDEGVCGAAPVDPLATRQARRLLCYLNIIYGKRILSGQQESTWIKGPDYEMNYIHDATGHYPAIRGLDMPDGPGSIDRAIAWWRKGGIPSICWHLGAPTKPDNYEGSKQQVSINAVLTQGTAENQSFLSRLDSAAANLARAQASGIAILWRPFHEAGGTWFWWSKEGGSQYIRLWRFEFDYFTHVKGLHNLVWLFPYNGEPNSAFWPGKAYVDLAGTDTYASDHGPLVGMYNTTRDIVSKSISIALPNIVGRDIVSRPMPIALYENGPIPDPDQLQSSGAKWVLFTTWHSDWLTDPKHNDQTILRKVYTSPYVITLGQLPNLN